MNNYFRHEGTDTYIVLCGTIYVSMIINIILTMDECDD